MTATTIKQRWNPFHLAAYYGYADILKVHSPFPPYSNYPTARADLCFCLVEQEKPTLWSQFSCLNPQNHQLPLSSYLIF